MHRWSFQRLIRWLIPSLVYGVALCGLVLEQKQTGVPRGLDFASDDAYRTLAVARSLGQRLRFELQADVPALALRDILPKIATAVIGRALNNYPAALILAGALLGWIAVLMLLRMARQLFPFPPFVLYTAILLIVSSGFLTGAATGESVTWGMALLSVAVAFHVEGLADLRSPLERGVILSMGLLSLVRGEFFLLWVLLVLHALLISLLERRRDGTTGYVAVRFLTGLFVLSIFFAPLVALNLHAIHVPWPQALGAPLTADALADMTPSEAAGAYRSHVAEGIRLAYSALNNSVWMRGPLERVLTWMGLVFLGVLACFRKDERPFSVIPWLYILIPPALGIAYPFLGAAGFDVVLGALQPLGVLSASFLVFRVPFLIESVYRKFKPGLPEAPGFQIWWSAAGGMLVLVALVRSAGWGGEHVRELASVRAAREQVRQVLAASVAQNTALATDAAGWWAYSGAYPLVDLLGEGTPEVLSCLNSQGEYDSQRLKDFLREKNANAVLIWKTNFVKPDHDYEPVSLALREPAEGLRPSPRFYELKPPGAL